MSVSTKNKPLYLIQTDYEEPVYKPYGGNETFMYCHDPEVVVSGPAETGKTLAACWKVHIICCKYPDAQISLVRKTQKSIYTSVLQTLHKVQKGTPLTVYGGEKPEKFIYSNNATIWVGGMDNPDKVLSSERDIIYVNQAEELTQNDWELLSTRVTGRGAVIPYPQLLGDCNPGGSKHFLKERALVGNLTLIPTVHKDNPTLFDPETGEITESGKRTMRTLEGLTGVRRKRLLEGLWVTAEGAVYDTFDTYTHVLERKPDEFVTWYMFMDEGYTNPAVIGLVGEDPDGRWHIYKEFYRKRVLQAKVVEEAKKWAEEYHVDLIAVDKAAAGLIADLRAEGLPASGQKGRVLDGITSVQKRLRVAGDGKPRLTVEPTCVNTINEFESYIWKPEKDEPVKENDHAMDGVRYLDHAFSRTYSGEELLAWV